MQGRAMASFLDMLSDRSSKLWIVIRPAVLVVVYYIVQKVMSQQGFEWAVHTSDGWRLGLVSIACLSLVLSSFGFDFSKRATTMKLGGEK